MVRTQIQLTERQSEELKRLATENKVSVAEIIRSAVDDVLAHRLASDRNKIRRRAMSVVGAFTSKETDVSENHDKYLLEAYER